MKTTINNTNMPRPNNTEHSLPLQCLNNALEWLIPDETLKWFATTDDLLDVTINTARTRRQFTHPNRLDIWQRPTEDAPHGYSKRDMHIKKNV